MELQPPQPILVAGLFPPLLEGLLSLLEGLSGAAWDLPTVCSPWSVKDVAAHLLGGDLGILSWRRDGYSSFIAVESWEALVPLINEQNDLWMKASRRLSPRLITQLLRYTGEQAAALFQSLDPYQVGGPVDWVGPDPAPAWLDLAREYTERWHHQQHIRDAVGAPGLKEPRFLSPALDTFILALPRTFRDVRREPGTSIRVSLEGPAHKQWTLRSEPAGWRLYQGGVEDPAAEVSLADDLAWRIFTKGVPPDEARAHVRIQGDQALGEKVLETVSIIG